MNLNENDIQRCISFHGHSCPGLAIGMRAAEYCLDHFGHNDDMELVAICETDMCGVDAIQVLTGCTFGKGNLIHRDLGKTAFTFHSRKSNEGTRILLRGTDLGGDYAELRSMMQNDTAMDAERLQLLRSRTQQQIMAMDFDDLFSAVTVSIPAPRPAKILSSHTCDHCGESTMESRVRLFAGDTLCIPCFSKVEQKV